jgi:hypothetical protein
VKERVLNKLEGLDHEADAIRQDDKKFFDCVKSVVEEEQRVVSGTKRGNFEHEKKDIPNWNSESGDHKRHKSNFGGSSTSSCKYNYKNSFLYYFEQELLRSSCLIFTCYILSHTF